MASFPARLRAVRWYQWLLAAFAMIYIVYLALSYFYLPGKLKRVVETDISELIGREISVQGFAYNPFTMSLKAGNLSIADKPNKPLVVWMTMLLIRPCYMPNPSRLRILHSIL
jgi:hypothetical protein